MSSSLGVVLPDPAADAEAAAGLLEVAVRALRDAGVDEVVVLDRPDRRSPPAGVTAGRSDGTLPRTLALAAASARAGGHDRILLHRLDHALTPAAQVARVLGALDDGAAVAVPVLPVTDTVTAVAAGLLGRTVDRTHVRAVCSPWGFTRAALERAADAASAGGSGPATPGAAPGSAPGTGVSGETPLDAALRRAAAAGAAPGPVAVVPGDPAGAFLGDELSRRRVALAHPDAAILLPPLPAARPGRSPEDPAAAPLPAGRPPAGAGRVAAVVLAAGSGTRFGAPVNKAYLPLAGTTVLAHSLRRFAALPAVGPVVAVIRAQDEARARAVVASAGVPVELVIGGATRQESEDAALTHLAARIAEGAVDVIAFHDSARPLADADLCARVIATARDRGGAVPGVLRQELAVVTGDGAALLPDRTGPLVAVQTPQAFTAALVRDAHAAARAGGFAGTDTASVVTAYGQVAARWVPAPATNLKITFADDLPLAEALLRELDAG